MSDSVSYLSPYQTIAKVLVVGSFRAGKSTFINSASEIDPVWRVRSFTPEPKRSISLGRISIEYEFALYLIGIPGIDYADYFQEISQSGVFFNQDFIGTILVIDSRRPDTFVESMQILELVQTYASTSRVIAANFQNSPDEIRLSLNIPSEIPVVPCVATDKESVKRVLLALLDEVLKAMAGDKE